MICLIALVVFTIMGLFSVKYRRLSAQAFDCVFRRMTLRPCQSGLNQQVRTAVISFVSKKNVKAARFVVKYFEVLSWTFTIIMLLSIFFAAQGLYFYIIYGNCNGAGASEFCVFDKLHPAAVSTCADPSIISPNETFVKPSVDDDPSIGPNDAKVTIIEFGCFDCPYTKKAYPTVKQILKDYDGRIRFVFRDFPLPNHENSKLKPIAADCSLEQGKYWEFHDKLFEEQNLMNSVEGMLGIAKGIGLDMDKFNTCLSSQKYLSEVDKDFEDGKAAGVYGTPTFFINDEVVVGPKPYQYFRAIIDKRLKN